MNPEPRSWRPLVRVALPVAIAAVLVCLAILNVALVQRWRGEAEDGVLWAHVDGQVTAKEIAPGTSAEAAHLHLGDVLLRIDRDDITTVEQVGAFLHRSEVGQSHVYRIRRNGTETDAPVVLQATPTVRRGLYFSLAFVGILSVFAGASVRLRRPNDPATLHFFWITVAFFGGLAFTMSGRLDRLDYFFYWADAVAWLALPPLFFHFALVFPERADAWVRTDAGRAILPLVYVPAVLLGGARIALMAGMLQGRQWAQLFARLDTLDLIYLTLCLVGGLALMLRALRRLRSVTARRQLRWITWGSSVGAVPFILLYVVPYLFGGVPRTMEYSAVLLGCVPLAFASALVRYRLMDIEVILKKILVTTAVGLSLVLIYAGTLSVVSALFDADPNASSFWALFATLIVVLVAPWLWHAIQAGLDRLYYRDRYDYRRALVSFARELNSELDLQRLSTRLVERIRETLSVDRIAVYLADQREGTSRLIPVASLGFETSPPPIGTVSPLAIRLSDGQAISIDDPQPARRLSADEAAHWKDTGLVNFIPCFSSEGTIAVLALGRRAHGEPLTSEDMALLGAVAGQAATALENARLYGQLQGKAEEIERLRQFGDSVVESLSDGLVVVDLEDRVLRWNRRMEALIGVDRGKAAGRRLGALFSRPFVETLNAARRDAPGGTTLHRVSVVPHNGDAAHPLLLNVGVSPFHTDGGHAGWIIVLEDVTDRAHLEEQLRLSEKMAAIGLLAAGVAHEVNTPLTGISSFTQMLLDRSDPEDPKTQLLEKIERQTFRAAKIISSLLNLARPSTSDAAPVDLNAVIGDVLSLIEHQMKVSKIQLRRELSAAGVVVRGIEYKLQQVFLNLFLNARDAMPRGGWLRISSRIDHGHAVIEVSDTGTGIPAEQLARIYDPFFTTKPEGHGTGLGLSVTYGIVQEHGGTLTCDSEVGHGTTFRLVLPLADQPRVEAAQ
jgi:PAS domain S-box-containing protein